MPANLIIRHEDDEIAEPSACGQRYRLLSEGDKDVAAWAHAVDIDGAKLHYHKICTELYYVLNGEGKVVLDGRKLFGMPGSFAYTMSPQDVADVTAWIMGLK